MLSEEQLADTRAQLEHMYRQGDLGSAAIAAWILSSHAPGESAWKIFSKKILRETGAAEAPPQAIIDSVDASLKVHANLEAFATMCLGLLAHPGNVGLLAKMIDMAKQFERDDLLDGALNLLPNNLSDPALLNLKAARAHEDGRYSESAAAFRKLLEARPRSIDLQLNLSAALTGLEDWEGAIEVLEKILSQTDEKKEALFRLMPLYRKRQIPTEESLKRLDEVLLPTVDSASTGRVKAMVMSYLERSEDAIDYYEKALEFGDDDKTRFDMSLVQLKIGDYESGFENYRNRFACFVGHQWLKPRSTRYDGRVLDKETLLVWAEQGVGDEVFFGYTLEAIKGKAQNVTIAVDARLVDFFSNRYAGWNVVSRDAAKTLVEQNPEEFDFEIPMGELMPIFFGALAEMPADRLHPLFRPATTRLEEVREIIRAGAGGIKKPVIGISWRGGTDIDGKARSMSLPELVSGVPVDADVDIISLQYSGDVGQEILDLGDPRVRASGLHNRNDLEGVITLLSEVDAVISVDNAVVHFAASVGTPVQVIMPKALSQFRFKNEDFCRTFFPEVCPHYQSLDGDWLAPVADAWRAVLGSH